MQIVLWLRFRKSFYEDKAHESPRTQLVGDGWGAHTFHIKLRNSNESSGTRDGNRSRWQEARKKKSPRILVASRLKRAVLIAECKQTRTASCSIQLQWALLVTGSEDNLETWRRSYRLELHLHIHILCL